MQCIWYNNDAKVLAITWIACLDSNIWPWQCPLLHQILCTHVSSDSNSEHFVLCVVTFSYAIYTHVSYETWQEISYMVPRRIVQRELSHLLIKRAQCCLSISWMQFKFQIWSAWLPWLMSDSLGCLFLCVMSMFG